MNNQYYKEYLSYNQAKRSGIKVIYKFIDAIIESDAEYGETSAAIIQVHFSFAPVIFSFFSNVYLKKKNFLSIYKILKRTYLNILVVAT